MKRMTHKVFLLAAVVVLIAGDSRGSAETAITKKNLFERGGGGYALYRIPGIVVTKRGTILAYCEARRTGKSDWDAIDILLRRSTDGGRTWSEPRKIAHVEGPIEANPLAASRKLTGPDHITYNNPVAIADHETGAVHFLFCVEYMRCFYVRSDDDGVSFTKPTEITSTFDRFRPEYDWKVLATGPGHGIQLTVGPHKGRLIVPVWLSTGTGGNAHRPSVASVIFSDDHGRTWDRGRVALKDELPLINPSETAAVQLADGRVMLNARTESKAHRRTVTIGEDGTGGWSEPRFQEELWEPICMASSVRLTMKPEHGRNRILFANPHNLERSRGAATPGRSRDRRNLSVKLSYDEGETWPVNKSLQSGFGGYSDLAVLPSGEILCFYERGGAGDTNSYRLTYLTLARFSLEWLTDGRDSLERR